MKRSEVDINKLSPMMRQYLEIKNEYEDELILFRLGDFYELFFEDALIASRELELTLTGRAAGLEERVPMCGVPHHTVKVYIEKLVNKGFKVAVVEQLEDPKDTKTMVKRGVVEVFSKGTISDSDLLNELEALYIGSLLYFDDKVSLTFLDLSTGNLANLIIDNKDELIIQEILNHNIKEILYKDNLNSNLNNILKNNYNIELTFSDKYIDKEYLEFLNTIDDIRIKTGVMHLFYYLSKRQLKDLSYINKIEYLNKTNYLDMGVHTIRNLELIETLRLKERTYSLIWLLDKCKTAMGSRKLKDWLLNPLLDIEKINDRYNKIEVINNEFIIKDELRELLYEIYDIERLAGKTATGSINARDLVQLKRSLKVLPDIKRRIEKLGFNYNINTHEEIFNILNDALLEEVPITLKEGSLIKNGYNEDLDELKLIRKNGKDFILQFEQKVKEETGIKTLKIGFNKVFGYYIEVSKGQKNLVKDEFKWDRRQTLSNCERYISPELKEKESLILNAEDKINELEYKLFIELKDKVQENIIEIKKTADIISEIDAIISLAVCSDEYNLVRPIINKDNTIEIIDGRHPVVEIVQKNNYVANDCIINKDNKILLITGPNMSGKSTYMRQIAIISIMAQMGSFVPAKNANIPIFDKIFTRIGASDDLVSGESTFMVEMKEACNAITNATKNSLIIFDELGRGTATYDGIALAQGILEYISKNIKCITLFSTHYHELTKLEKRLKNIKNIHVSASEINGEITFLHKIQDGAIDKSYGIHVAKLANMPSDLLKRSEEILKEYENKKSDNNNNNVQLTLDFNNKEEPNFIEEKLKEIDIVNTTPLDALNILYDLKKNIK